ncbi:MAG: acyl-CoA dehydrogenase family protein [Chloroflexi bacterium]|nr:acyl-CoA dehydrogenase family protein [Chloroflexota bacterium]MDA1001965.1 acyl-CoA dehydrogenase family protein [Chloroflexota bacterium]
MDFGWDGEQAGFRAEVRAFIDEHWTRGARRERELEPWERARAYQKRLAEHGWLTRAWPKAYGGADASYFEQLIFAEESAYSSAPTGGQGADRVGPTLIIHGNEAQKQEHLPRIASAEVEWCQGYSEPGAGSDLASLQTRAVRDGDDFVINGQKIWTSGAQHADWIHVLTRTDPDAPKHRGISYFMVPMDTPGITLRPIVQLHDQSGFNETFFEDVRVPAKHMIGEENRGWYVSTTTLDFERSGIHRIAAAVPPFRRLFEFARQPDSAGDGRRVVENPVHRLALADTATEIEVGKLLGYRVTWMQARSLVPNMESSMSKMFGSETQQRLARRGVNMLGLAGTLRGGEPRAPLGGEFGTYYMSSVSLTIAAGTSEIQRNIIATRGLGLPRG